MLVNTKTLAVLSVTSGSTVWYYINSKLIGWAAIWSLGLPLSNTYKLWVLLIVPKTMNSLNILSSAASAAVKKSLSPYQLQKNPFCKINRFSQFWRQQSDPRRQTADDTVNQSNRQLPCVWLSNVLSCINPTLTQGGTFFPLSIPKSKIQVPLFFWSFLKTIRPT